MAKPLRIRLESDFEDYYDAAFDVCDPEPGVYTLERYHRAPISRIEAFIQIDQLGMLTVPWGLAGDLRKNLEKDRRPDDREVVCYADPYWHGPTPGGNPNLRLQSLGAAVEENPKQLVTLYSPVKDKEGHVLMQGVYTIGDRHVTMVALAEVAESESPTGFISTWGKPTWKHHVHPAGWDDNFETPMWAMQMTQIRERLHGELRMHVMDFEFSPRLAGTPLEVEMPPELVVDLLRQSVERFGFMEEGDREEQVAEVGEGEKEEGE